MLYRVLYEETLAHMDWARDKEVDRHFRLQPRQDANSLNYLVAVSGRIHQVRGNACWHHTQQFADYYFAASWH